MNNQELYSQNMRNLKAASVNQEYVSGILDTPVDEDMSLLEKAQAFEKQFSYTTNVGEAVRQATELALNLGMQKTGFNSALSSTSKVSDGAVVSKKIRAMKRAR